MQDGARLFLPELADHEHVCIDKLGLYLWDFHGFWMVLALAHMDMTVK
jgi:hypothetical protein